MRYIMVGIVVAAVLVAAGSWGYKRNAALKRLKAAGAEVQITNADSWYGGLLWQVSGFAMGQAKPNDELLADINAVAASLTELDLSGHPITDAGVENLADCDDLVAMNLSKTQVTDQSADVLADCNNLKSLWLDDTKLTDAGLADLDDLSALETLSLARTGITDAGLIKAAGWQRLKALDLSGTKLNGTFLQKLGKQCQLTTLTLDGTSADAASLSALAVCDQLQSLSLRQFQLSQAGIEAIAQLRQLQRLDLSNSNLNSAGMRSLLASARLHTLIVAGTQAGKGLGAEPLPAPGLEEIDLSTSGLTDIDVLALTGLTGLKILNLDGNSISDAATDVIVRLSGLESIRITNTRMAVASAHRMYKALPKARIYYGNAGSVGWLGYRR